MLILSWFDKSRKALVKEKKGKHIRLKKNIFCQCQPELKFTGCFPVNIPKLLRIPILKASMNGYFWLNTGEKRTVVQNSFSFHEKNIFSLNVGFYMFLK